MAKDCALTLGPVNTLVFFALMNTLIYLDRGVISVILKTLTSKAEMDLDETSTGALGSIFILGFMLSSPIFAFFGQHVASTTLVAIGMTIWAVATLSAGLAVNYTMLMIARAVTGVGEASLVCLAPPLILDSAPGSKKTLWVSIFYSAMTIGYALGFVFGHETMTLTDSWRWPLVIESVMMLPLILIAFFLKVPQPEIPSDSQTSLTRQLLLLGKNPVFILVVAGYSAYAFTIGGLAFWGNSIIQTSYEVSAGTAVASLGAMTVFCGVVATLLGSLYMDYLLEPVQLQADLCEISEKELQAHRTEVACKLACLSITLGAVLGTIGVFFRSFRYFITALTASEFLLFLGTGPVGMAVMSSVPAYMRGQANAVSVFLMHLLGDFPSPYIVGLVSHLIGAKWGMLILVSWLFVGALAWVGAWAIARTKRIDEQQRETEESSLIGKEK